MHQHRRFVFGEVVDAGVKDGGFGIGDVPGSTLGLAVNSTRDFPHSVCAGVEVSSGDGQVLADSQLEEHRRVVLVACVCQGKDPQRKPLSLLVGGPLCVREHDGLVGVIGLGAQRLVVEINDSVVVVKILSIIVVVRIAPSTAPPTGQGSPSCPAPPGSPGASLPPAEAQARMILPPTVIEPIAASITDVPANGVGSVPSLLADLLVSLLPLRRAFRPAKLIDA